MKKYSILLAITALIVASLACQTLMGGGGNSDDTQVQPLPPVDSGDSSQPTEESSNSGDSGFGDPSQSPFPLPSDAYNIGVSSEVVAYQTNLSTDEVIKFYQDEFGKLGYTEDTSQALNFSGVFTMVFNGHESGRQIFIAGAPAEDGSTAVTIVFQ
jgi:hypothetical protein